MRTPALGLRLLLTATLGAAALMGVVRPAAAAPVHVGPADFPDPDVLLVHDAGGTPRYVAHATGTGEGDGYVRIQVMTSPDLVHWSTPREALASLPSWAVERDHFTWAPSVVPSGDGFAMYYVLRHPAPGGGRQCISVATAEEADGLFVDRSSGPLVCQLAQGGSIDPSVVDGPEGRRHLIWKSEENGLAPAAATNLWSQELSADGRQLTGAGPTLLLRAERPWQGDPPLIEGPDMVAVDDRYILFYGAGAWQSDRAAMGYAVCDSPVGPCRDRSAQPWHGTGGALVGPAGPDVFRDAEGRWRLAFHAWTGAGGATGYDRGAVRSLWLEELTFLPGGRPRAADAGTGYRLLGADGSVHAFGAAGALGDARALVANRPGASAVDLDATPSGRGYWVVDDRGAVAAFGEAPVLGDVPAGWLEPGEQATSLSATPSGGGYWVFTSRGRVLPFGDATSHGDLTGVALAGPVLDAVPTTTGDGYWMVASDGGIFTFGDAAFLGSMGGQHLNQPVQGLVPTPEGGGYWLVAADGGVFSFGEAPFWGSLGSIVLNRPVIGMVPFGAGYLMLGSDGGVFTFSDQPFAGSLGDRPGLAPITAVATA